MDEKFHNRFIQRIKHEKDARGNRNGLTPSPTTFSNPTESIEPFVPQPSRFEGIGGFPAYRKTFHLLYFLFFGAIAGTLVLGLSVALVIPLFFRGTYENIAVAYGWW